jgi:hypothetical protein
VCAHSTLSGLVIIPCGMHKTINTIRALAFPKKSMLSLWPLQPTMVDFIYAIMTLYVLMFEQRFINVTKYKTVAIKTAPTKL